MIAWIVQNKEWVFSGIGVAVLGALWWLWKKLFASAPVSNTVTQSPTITVSPNITVSQTTVAPEPHKHSTVVPLPSAEEVEAQRPTLFSLHPRICLIRPSDDLGFTEGGGPERAVLATFRMSKPSADRRGTHITARLSFQTSSVAGFWEISKEFGRVNYGTWIDEDFNSVSFAMTDTKELILVMGGGDRQFVAVQDNRHGSTRINEPSYWEIEPLSFFVDVTLVDEIYGPLITYRYEIETDPLKVSEIIRVPRVS